MKFSANIGFLFREHGLEGAVAAAAAVGFDAVECHWPYATPAATFRAALAQSGLPLICLNTSPGNTANGDFGLAAVPGRESEARVLIGEAVDYAAEVGGRAVHVMAGNAEGHRARTAFIDNLRYAADYIGARDIELLIEPLNHRDAPGYFLRTLEQALDVIDASGIPQLRIMFDCYHMQIEGGDLLTRFSRHRDAIGHIQFAAVPSRAEPDGGEVAYDRLLRAFVEAGYMGWFGAEYRPGGATLDGLAWLKSFRSPASTAEA